MTHPRTAPSPVEDSAVTVTTARPLVTGPADVTVDAPDVADARAENLPVDAAEVAKVVNRLKRAEGQLAGVIRMLEEGRSCQDVVVQLSAVSKALDRAGFALISSSLEQCLLASHGQESVDVQKLRRLFLTLA